MSFFEPAKTEAPRGRELVLRARGIEARGFESAQGFIVREGARAVKTEVPSIPASVAAHRKDLRARGVLAENGNELVLSQDYVFSSPSAAAGVLLGRSANGLLEWKAADGRTLKQVQEAEAVAR